MGAAASAVAPLSVQHARGLTAFNAHQFEDAIAWFTAAMPEKSTSLTDRMELATLYICRSKAYKELGHIGKALDDAMVALDLHPTSTEAYICAATSAMQTEGGKRLARDYIAKACAISPDDKNALLLKESLFAKFQPREHGVGHVFSWGSGDEMQLGHGTASSKAMPHMIDTMRGKQIGDVACGAMHTLALSTNGELYAWGNNQYGQCGLVNELLVITPQLIPSLVGVIISSIACGAGHSVAIAVDGSVYSWGIGKQGQLGHGQNLTSAAAPVLISSISTPVEAVACGIAHTILLLNDGGLLGFGQNQYGQLGIQSESCVMTPTAISFSEGPIRQIACGGAHSCLVNDKGQLFACGSNSCGQLGLGHFEDTSTLNCSGVSILPPLALVVCGEEFSAALSQDKSQIFTWGLGIAGQMGDDTSEGYCSPHVVPGIDEAIEMLSVSQAQVFAITESGSVLTWGLPGDRAFDSSSKISKPERVGAFFGKKRIQTLACGRKHYVLITLGAFAPFSKLTWDKKCKHIAGTWCHFEIQTYDNRDVPCQTGGYIFTSYLTLVEAASQIDNTYEISVEMNDNMNGTYSGRYRVYVAGSYLLNITLDHLGISGHPFAINVSPGAVYPSTCSVEWSHALPLVLRPNNELSIVLELCDRYGNKIPTKQSSEEDDEQLCLCYQIVDSKNHIIVKDSIVGCSICLQIPSLPGSYMIHIGIDGVEEKHAIQDSPFPLVVQKDKTTTEALAALGSKTRIVFPSEAIAGERFTISLELDDNLPDDCYYTIYIESTTKSHQLSARALVRWGATDPLAPMTKLIRHIAGSTESIVLKVAGSYEIKVSISNDSSSCDVDKGEISVIANRAAPEFTALTNWSHLLTEHEDGIITCPLRLQLHDKCGNPTLYHPEDMVSAWLSSVEDTNCTGEKLIVENLSDSVISIFFPMTKNGESFNILKLPQLWLHIHLNNVPIEYSPFQLGSATIELPPPPPIEPRNDTKKLLREEATRRRAEEALRRERAQLREERERKQRQQNMRRTGGGFTIKYSSD